MCLSDCLVFVSGCLWFFCFSMLAKLTMTRSSRTMIWGKRAGKIPRKMRRKIKTPSYRGPWRCP